MTVEVPQAVPEYGGCIWPADPACFSEVWASYPEGVRERALRLASSTLQRLTGGRVGHCPITVRPCKAKVAETYRGFPHYGVGSTQTWDDTWVDSQDWPSPMNWGGSWINSCACAGSCECDLLGEVRLPEPVGRVDEVRVDGLVVDPTLYRLDYGNILVWQGEGPSLFPAVQDLSKPITAPGTFAVTYLNAYPVDSNGAYAVAVLAREYAEACVGNECRLPTGVTSIARQGVSMEIASGAFPGGLTGLYEVDAFITLWRPEGSPTRPPTVWSPDIAQPRVSR